MSSTFSAPLRINVRNNPSNDGTSTPSNAGAAICSQQAPVVGGAVSAVVVPAGSIINNIVVYLNVVGAASRAVTIDGVAVGTVTTTALGVASFTPATTAAAANKLANVGTADAVVTLGTEAGSAGVFSVSYTPRNTDGTITPYGSGYTNS